MHATIKSGFRSWKKQTAYEISPKAPLASSLYHNFEYSRYSNGYFYTSSAKKLLSCCRFTTPSMQEKVLFMISGGCCPSGHSKKKSGGENE